MTIFSLATHFDVIYQRRSQKPPQTSKMESFVTIINSFWLFIVVAKFSIFDVGRGPG